jgi:single-strand DNA-binding protein
MNETVVTVVGNVATAPVYRETSNGPVARFRLAATARQRDRATGEWSDGHTNFFTVWARRNLGANVAGSVSIGDPVVVQGRLKVRDEDRGQGRTWTSADIDASVVGHDLSRGTAAFRRGRPSSEPGAAAGVGQDVWQSAPPGAQPAPGPSGEPMADHDPFLAPATGVAPPSAAPGNPAAGTGSANPAVTEDREPEPAAPF